MKHYLLSIILFLIYNLGYTQVGELRLNEKDNIVNIKEVDKGLRFHFQQEKLLYSETKSNEGELFTDIWFKGSYPIGEIGSPKLPAYKKLIRIPRGSKPVVKVKSYTQQVINLKEKGVKNPLIPNQPSIRKDQDTSQVKFQIRKEVYSKNEYGKLPIAKVEILGTLRSATIARLVVSPVDYNPVNGLVKVYNNIDISIDFEDVNAKEDEDLALNTYSPYFDIIYKSYAGVESNLYNEHPDLTKYPVKMLIVSDRMFEQTLQPFIEWKKLKGFNVITAYTDVIGTTANQIKTFIQQQYSSSTPESPAPSFLVLVGDIAQVPASATGSSTGSVTDLYYASVDGDMFPDMYYGRLSATTTDQLNNIIGKILYYEKYQFADPSYLNDVTLIAGVDGSWNYKVGQPTIKYSTANYFNASRGFNKVNEYGVTSDPNNPSASSSYAGCYSTESISVGIVNYTAHGSQSSWVDPYLGNSSFVGISNTNKYPLAIGNCCLSGDFGYSECLGEAWIRGQNKGAVTYIGSAPNTFWLDDFYWAVGAFPMVGENNGYVPTIQETTIGIYDAPYVSNYVTTGGIVFAGNLAVTEADIQGYNNDSSPLYYWQAYNVLGDPSLIPYYTEAEQNQINHRESVIIGESIFKISALAGSYIALSKDNQLIGTYFSNSSDEIDVPITPIIATGDVVIVVTRPQTVPYIDTITAITPTGPYLLLNSFTIDDHLTNNNGIADFDEIFAVNLNVKNIGVETATNVKIKVSRVDNYINILGNDSISIGNIQSTEGINIADVLAAFSFEVIENIPDQYIATFNLRFYSDQGSWTSKLKIRLNSPAFTFEEIQVNDSLTGNNDGFLNPGESIYATIKLTNTGHAQAKKIACNILIPDSLQNTLLVSSIETESFSLEPGDSYNYPFRISTNPNYKNAGKLPILVAAKVSNPSGLTDTIISYLNLVPTDTIRISNDTLVTCFTYFYDSAGKIRNYGNSENFTTTFVAKDDYSTLQLKFSEFSTEKNYDFLYIYNGSDITAPQVSGSPFSGKTLPPDIFSSGRSLTIRFRSDDNTTDKGWVATIECLNPTSVPLCATTPTPTSGSIDVQSGSLSWTQPLYATFYDVYIGTSPENFGFAGQVKEPNFNFKPEKNKTYYWKVAPGNYLGTNNSGCETWDFSTDTICNEVFMSKGAVEVDTLYFYDSGGPLLNYKNKEDYTLTFKPKYIGNKIEVKFLAFNIESHSTCNYDKLQIYDGLTTSSTLIGTYCGTSLPNTIQSTNSDGALTFKFISDISETYSGWKAIVKSIGTTSIKTLSFIVKSNNIPVSNASININGLIKTTDQNGLVNFNAVPGNIIYKINALDYQMLTDTVLVEDSNQTILVELTKLYSINLHFTDAVKFTPIIGVKIKFNNDSLYTDANGNVVVKLSLGSHSLTALLAGYETLNQSLTVTEGFTNQDLVLSPKNYKITLLVQDPNGSKIENALININNNNLLTNSEGKIISSTPWGSYDISISKEGFFPLKQWLLVNDTINQKIQLDPILKLYNVEFTFYGSGPKDTLLVDNIDLTITFDNVLYSQIKTNSVGKGILSLPNGTFFYSTLREGFHDISDKKLIIYGSNISLLDTLKQKTFSVTFNITTSSVPVQDAVVTLDGYNPYSSNSFGVATIDEIGYEKNLQYSIQRNGYLNASGYINVIEPINLNINLVTSSIPIEDIKSLKLFPNPTSDQLNIISDSPISRIQIFTISGKIIEDKLYNEVYSTHLSLKNSPIGVYIIATYFKNSPPARSLVIKK
ncbi:MAG: C25 family cysteine peptidase [Tenuifilaceae bacterium]